MPGHLAIKYDHPGKCPICGMTLIPVMEPPPLPAPSATSAVIPSPLYTCPMAIHADVVSDKPGKCPKCEMNLVPTTAVKHGKTAEENWKNTAKAHEHEHEH